MSSSKWLLTLANGFIDANSLEIEDGQVVGWHSMGISGLRVSLERTLWPAMWEALHEPEPMNYSKERLLAAG
jgi:hypothetical protein